MSGFVTRTYFLSAAS